MLEQKITLRAKTVGFQPVIKTSQGDTGRKLLCSFEDFTIPDSSTAKIYVMKPSGKSVQNDVSISEQTITVELTNQILAEKGIVACQIQVLNSGKSVKSFEFSLDNERSLAGDWPESENENTFLEGVVSEMQAKLTETINLANAATSAAKTATQDAKNATANANAAADEARQTVWNNKNLTNSTSASESQVETAAGAAVLTGVDGKTKQVTTTGVNLVDASDGVLITHKLPKPLDPGTYTVSFETDSPSGDFRLSNTTDTSSDSVATSGSSKTGERLYLTLTTNFVSNYINISISGGTHVSGIMLNSGDSALPYELYTGGIPGPNPDYQIPVQGVGGETGDKSFGFNAAIQSYQLFDASKIPTKTKGGATVINNGDGSFTISGSGELSSGHDNRYRIDHDLFVKLFKQGTLTINVLNSSNPYFVLSTYNSTGIDKIISFYTKTKDSIEITDDMINNDEYYANIGFYGKVSEEIKPVTIKPMMYQDGDGTFQKYHRSELPITLTQPLFEGDKIMQVKAGQTYVDADGVTQTADRDLWGVYRTKKQVNYNGSEMWVESSQVENRYTLTTTDAKKEQKVYCDHFIGSKIGTKNINECYLDSNTNFYVNTEMESLELWKQWLSEHNIKVVYELMVPYFEPFADQTPFFAWTTPTGGCIITTDDPLNPIISADTAQTPEGSYLLTGYIDGLRGRTLEQRILELEKNTIQGV